MDKETAISKLTEYARCGLVHNGRDTDQLQDWLNAINGTDWISVDDRLPISELDMNGSNYMTVEIIIATKHFVSFDSFIAENSIDFWCGFENYKKEVTHWQPLPDPPKQ